MSNNKRTIMIIKGAGSASSIRNHAGVTILFSKNDVRSNNLIRANNLFEELRKAGIKAGKKITLLFDGYNNDPREIWQIPEIRSFVTNIFTRYPELLFYLKEQTRKPIIYCLMKPNRIIRDGQGNMHVEIPMSGENNQTLIKLVAEAYSYYLRLKK